MVRSYLRQSANGQAEEKDGLISSHKSNMEHQIFSSFGIILEGDEH